MLEPLIKICISASFIYCVDGAGYVEDGREVFDDDLDDASNTAGRASKKSGPKPGKKGMPVKSSNIKNMFLNMSSNRDV